MCNYCSEEGKWWKTRLPLNQHLACELMYLRTSIRPQSNTATWAQAANSGVMAPISSVTKEEHTPWAWANQSTSASCQRWRRVHRLCSSWGCHTPLHCSQHHLSYKSILFSHLDVTDLKLSSEKQSGIILTNLLSRQIKVSSMMPYSLSLYCWGRTYYLLSFRKWRCIITEITTSTN